jgi:hypothetical protein
MKLRDTIKSSFVCLLLIGVVNVGFAENIDPYEDGSQYAWGENIGWVNFEPNIVDPNNNIGATASDEKLTGFIWAENIGWISLSCENTGSCVDVDYGVTNDGAGNLSGYAWGENVGWINFDPDVPGDSNDYGVTIDSEGDFDGWAFGENIGWINFDDADLFGYGVLACKVNLQDLANFVDDWLKAGQPGDLNGDDEVDFMDYGIFASYWLDYCPDDWPL